MSNLNNIPMHVPTELKSFAYIDFNAFLPILAEKAQSENWKNLDENDSNNEFPILFNYVVHTYKRLAYLYNNAKELKEKSQWIKFKGAYAIFNTGLYSPNFNELFFVFKKNSKPIYNEFYCLGVYEECDYEVLQFNEMPKRAEYFNSYNELIYDTNLELVINLNHILDDENNRKRLPQQYMDNPEILKTLLAGAINMTKKRIDANYRIAIPQVYNGKNQFLIPLYFSNNNKPDLVLAVKRIRDKYYKGYTCLTLDQAYNNARLLAKPETNWLAR